VTSPRRVALLRLPVVREWQRDALRTNLWLVPAVEVVVAVGLFALTHAIDRAAYRGEVTLPSWTISGTADAARQILTALAAAVITVVGIVFSITIVTLTLASTQFGPRMLRNFIRDRGTQFALGTFVATFVYAVLTLVSISPGTHGAFVPHLSITVSIALVVLDMGVLIFFIHQIATSIQLPQVIASIASDLARAIEAETAVDDDHLEAGPSLFEIQHRLDEEGTSVMASSSGYLQFVRYDRLTAIATRSRATVRLLHRPGHFLVEGSPLAIVWPPDAAPAAERVFARMHFTGPHRTLTQDISFAVDQLVEIAIRALSPAVNDTFTALTCVDWLGDSLCKSATRWNPPRVLRDRAGWVRVITAEASYDRLVQRAFEKIRQASAGMPAVMIRQLDALAKIMAATSRDDRRPVLMQQAEMILRASEETVHEPADRADVRRSFDALATAYEHAPEVIDRP
jgi:uncharacterized membrane protein